ncbi:MAG: hypothetical protein LBQ07_00830 [Endomicrobium sp.]|jgi:hypothetical protein|nr:hypothetical protein [Endomicrobium sp.]
MSNIEMQIETILSSSKLGRYEIVKLALEWILVNQIKEEYKKVNHYKLINMALEDIIVKYVKN